MRLKERFELFVNHFAEHFPEAETELHYNNPFQLLVAVVLSAQCTDKRVNMVTPVLFEAFPSPEALAASHFDELFPYIKSISYPNNKTKHLLGLGKMLVEQFGSKIPETVEDLQKLPGVGRKTANVIASVVYNQPTMAVDTHVFRVSKRIGLAQAKAKTPLEVEKQLVKHIPKEVIPKAHHWLILHGRYVCLARRPLCEQCQITHFCKYFQSKTPADKPA
ncbi:MAG TPA: endonuclease III [Microscillaceae bacterium]|jgi:endonuclease-3|nr:endonuclease III [Microscillaceae bacterium]